MLSSGSTSGFESTAPRSPSGSGSKADSDLPKAKKQVSFGIDNF